MQLVKGGGFIKIESQNETETLPIAKKCLEIRLHKNRILENLRNNHNARDAKMRAPRTLKFSVTPPRYTLNTPNV